MYATTLRRTFSLGLVALALGACDKEPSGPDPVHSVALSPSSSTVIVGARRQLALSIKNDDGQELTDRDIAWSSSNTAIATVSATGEVTGVSVGGPVAISATVEGRTGTAEIMVIPVPVDRVELGPNPAQVGVGLTTQLTVVARDAAGNALTGRPVTMTSTSTAVATVTNGGLVTGVRAGMVTITATVEGRTGTAVVNVVPGPVAAVQVTLDTPDIREAATKQLAVTLRDASGAVVTGRTITYGTSNPAVATASATGLITAVAPGTSTLTATSEGSNGSIVVTVLPAQVSTVLFAPLPSVNLQGDTARATVTVRDSLGRTLTGHPATYSSSNTFAATISSTGHIIYAGTGPVTLSATVEGRTGSQTLNILPLFVTLPRTGGECHQLRVGQSCTLTAVLRYGVPDNLLSGTFPIAFTGNNPGVATLAQSGPNTATATAVSPGVMNYVMRFVTPSGIVISGGGSITVTAP